jgi:hypothetical protein
MPVFTGEVRGQLGYSGEVKAAIPQHRQEHGMLPCGASHQDAQIGLGFREVEDLGAVREHRGRGFASIEPSLVDLADVGDEVGFHASGPPEDLGQAAEQLVVGDCVERKLMFHGRNDKRAEGQPRSKLQWFGRGA